MTGCYPESKRGSNDNLSHGCDSPETTGRRKPSASPCPRRSETRGNPFYVPKSSKWRISNCYALAAAVAEAGGRKWPARGQFRPRGSAKLINFYSVLGVQYHLLPAQLRYQSNIDCYRSNLACYQSNIAYCQSNIAYCQSTVVYH
jgi:hypothetical protein